MSHVNELIMNCTIAIDKNNLGYSFSSKIMCKFALIEEPVFCVTFLVPTFFWPGSVFYEFKCFYIKANGLIFPS